jgi:hypothetical protein
MSTHYGKYYTTTTTTTTAEAQQQQDGITFGATIRCSCRRIGSTSYTPPGRFWLHMFVVLIGAMAAGHTTLRKPQCPCWWTTCTSAGRPAELKSAPSLGFLNGRRRRRHMDGAGRQRRDFTQTVAAAAGELLLFISLLLSFLLVAPPPLQHMFAVAPGRALDRAACVFVCCARPIWYTFDFD